MIDLIENTGEADAERCSVGSESRPALGCPRPIDIVSQTVPFPAGEVLTVRAPLPRSLRDGSLVLETSLQSDEVEGWKATEPRILEGRQSAIRLEVAIPDEVTRKKRIRVRVVGRRIPEKPEPLRTRAFEIRRGAVLHVGLAVDTVAAELGAAPTEFTILARGRFGSRELLRSVVEPETTRRRWLDRTVPLDAVVGEAVSLELRARLLDTRAPPSRTSFTWPIWGNPQILEPMPRGERRNLIVVSLDTLRGDFVGAAREGRRLTPWLDARSAEGTRFTNALAPYPSTTASHMSLFTSRYPGEHKVLHAKHRLADRVPTLAQIFADHGFETAAFTENGMLAAASGFERGFDVYDENRGVSMWDARGDIETTLERGLRWMRRHRREQFFLFLHTYQVHHPYQPPPAHDVFTAGPEPGEKQAWARQRNRYAGEVVYTDLVLRRLFRSLARLGLDEETIVVITADHGDEFGEHGRVGHSKTVYDEVLRVPLLFWAPGLVPAGRTVDELVSLVDVAPTLLELVGLPIPEDLRGENLAGVLLRGGTPPATARFAEGPAKGHPQGRLFAARTQTHKWITREGATQATEIYDLRADPGEHENLASDARLQDRGRPLLETYRALDAASEPADQPDGEVDPETQQKLRALGYLD